MICTNSWLTSPSFADVALLYMSDNLATIASLFSCNSLGVNLYLVPSLDSISFSIPSSRSFIKNTLLVLVAFTLPCWSVGIPQYTTLCKNDSNLDELADCIPLGSILFLASCIIASAITLASCSVCFLFLSLTAALPSGSIKNAPPEAPLYSISPVLTGSPNLGINIKLFFSRSTEDIRPASCEGVKLLLSPTGCPNDAAIVTLGLRLPSLPSAITPSLQFLYC